jgi:hypothetical protein
MCCWWLRWQWRRGEKKRKKRVDREEKNLGRKTDFLPTLGYDFLILKAWNPPLFIGGGRGTLCLFWRQILAIDSNMKNLNCWFKGVIMVCQNRLLKLVMLATLGWHHSGYRDSWPARPTRGCSTMSSHHGGVWFARFSVGGRIIKYPWEIATWATF